MQNETAVALSRKVRDIQFELVSIKSQIMVQIIHSKDKQTIFKNTYCIFKYILYIYVF